MKKYYIVFLISLFYVFHGLASQPLKFALISDTHIQTQDSSIYNLKRVIKDINHRDSLEFVLIAGDIVQNADSASFLKVKNVFNLLKKPYYVVPGNHDTLLKGKYTDDYFNYFNKNFSFLYKDFQIIGFSTAPYESNGKGNVDKETFFFLEKELSQTPKDKMIFCVIHHPLLAVDVKNYERVTNLLKKYSVNGVLCGHYHRNTVFSFDGILGIVNRAIYRSSDSSVGYNLYEINEQNLIITEVNITRNESEEWLRIPIEN